MIKTNLDFWIKWSAKLIYEYSENLELMHACTKPNYKVTA